jgi:hypothetical protein
MTSHQRSKSAKTIKHSFRTPFHERSISLEGKHKFEFIGEEKLKNSRNSDYHSIPFIEEAFTDVLASLSLSRLTSKKLSGIVEDKIPLGSKLELEQESSLKYLTKSCADVILSKRTKLM